MARIMTATITRFEEESFLPPVPLPYSIDIVRIREMIPHRYPMLLIDRVVDVVRGMQATGVKAVSAGESYFQGHFPERPVLPGVLIVEAMAQTAAVMVVDSLGENAAGKLVYFMSIQSAKFRKPVVPGDMLRMVVRKVQNRKNVWKFDGQAFVEEGLVAEASFAAMIMEEE